MNQTDDTREFTPPTPIKVGLLNRCPRCANGPLFVGLLEPAKECSECSLDYGFIDSGDGPAVFVILIIGFLITGMAMLLQSVANPPIWVHMLIWIPVLTAASIWSLRLAKGIMIALQYQTSAREGALEETR